jgi:hydrogenase nickel incorporation protein HypB
MGTTCGESGHVLMPAGGDGRGQAHEKDGRGQPREKDRLRPLRGPGWVREVRTVRLQRELLAENNRIASQTRRLLAEIGVTMFNLVGAPGSGKTALLEATIGRLRHEGVPLVVLEGDQTNDLDARSIESTGCRVLSILTGTGCHLDAAMVAEGMSTLSPEPGTIVLVENVGNLVCPALFDLGERSKVVVMSVTEGEDKPLKYSYAFRAADLFVLTKVDLAPHVAFDEARCIANARRVNPGLRVVAASTVLPGGLDEWCEWVKRQRVE